MSAYKCSSSSDDLEDLKKVWYKKLKQEGFVDIEDDRQRLKAHDTRTIAFENRDIICNFFIKLDHFLTESKTLLPLHRTILELYSSGCRIKDISAKVNRNVRTINGIINRYKEQVKNGTAI